MVVLAVAATVGAVLALQGGNNSPSAGLSDQTLLKMLVVKQSDVESGYIVRLFGDGNQINNQVTLDLCGANFPSEALRVARRQVGASNTAGSIGMSTEAVLYRDPAATNQAFAELRSAQATCPSTFVSQDVAGEPPLKTVFGPPPDAAWPSVPGVDRLAFAVTLSDQQGRSQQSVSIYLRRGPYLLGVYAPATGPQVPVDGQTSLEGITMVFEHRLAAVPLPG